MKFAINRLPLVSIIALAVAGGCSARDSVPTQKPPVLPPSGETQVSNPVVPTAPSNVERPSPLPAPAGLNANAYHAMCNGQARDLADVLRPIVDDLVAQKIPYSRDPANEWRDCSGNFLRLSSYVASACPELRAGLAAPPGVRAYSAGGNNAVPLQVNLRSSRSVAEWYHAQGRFTPVYYDGVTSIDEIPADLRKARHLIRPGAVVWFSRGKPTASGGVNALFNKTGSGGHINHMGTVTQVERNERGEVISYRMYHGHGKAAKRTPASVTNRQFLVWPLDLRKNGAVNYPPLGYWSQRIVGVGTLVPVLTASAAN